MNEKNDAPVVIYDVNEAAKLLGISRQAVNNRIRAGIIPAIKKGGSYIIMADDLHLVIEEEIARILVRLNAINKPTP